MRACVGARVRVCVCVCVCVCVNRLKAPNSSGEVCTCAWSNGSKLRRTTDVEDSLVPIPGKALGSEDVVRDFHHARFLHQINDYEPESMAVEGRVFEH